MDNEIGYEGVNSMYLTQDRDQWWTLDNAIMSHYSFIEGGNFLTH
jgi:hypothetical protein